MRHEIEYKCYRPDTCGGTCFGCTLGECKNCGQTEGGLATECPGVIIDENKARAIYEGQIDFINGSWVKGKNCKSK